MRVPGVIRCFRSCFRVRVVVIQSCYSTSVVADSKLVQLWLVYALALEPRRRYFPLVAPLPFAAPRSLRCSPWWFIVKTTSLSRGSRSYSISTSPMMQGNPHKWVTANAHIWGSLSSQNKIGKKTFIIVLLPCFLASSLPDRPANTMVYPLAPCGYVHNPPDLLPRRPYNCHPGESCGSWPFNGSPVSLLPLKVCAPPLSLNGVS